MGAMVHIQTCYNAASTKAYLGRDEPGAYFDFFGQGIRHFDMDAGQMTVEHFYRMVDNKHPERDEQITPRQKDNRIVGWDITGRAPKDVSMLALMHPNAELRQKVRDAWNDAFRHGLESVFQPTIQVRDRRGGKCEDRTTGNGIWFNRQHSYARPQDGKVAPHMHNHGFMLNLSWDRVRGSFLAAKIHRTFWQVPKMERAIRQRLRENLHDIGIRTAGWGSRWRVSDIPRSLVEKFSPRHVAAKAREAEGVPPEFAAMVGREDKPPEFKLDELREQWNGMMTDYERRCLRNVAPRPKWGRYLHPGREKFDFLSFARRAERQAPTTTPEVSRGFERE